VGNIRTKKGEVVRLIAARVFVGTLLMAWGIINTLGHLISLQRGSEINKFAILVFDAAPIAAGVTILFFYV